MTGSVRCHKVADLLKREIGVLLQTEVKDPAIGFVTVTDVEVSADLRNARVYVSVLGDGDRKHESLKGLERARPYLQNLLGSRVRLRYLPVLRFLLDESIEYGNRIDALIDRIQAERRESDNLNGSA
jgi:ribosome-binding factor A